MPRTPTSLFISYSRRNSFFVDQLEAELCARNFFTWVDRRDVESSPSWKKVLQDAIDQCDVVLLVLSPAALYSPQVRMEYSYALRKGKPLLGLEHQSSELPSDLINIRRIGFSTENKQVLQDLCIALNHIETVVPAKVRQAKKARYRFKYYATSSPTSIMEAGPHATRLKLINLYKRSVAVLHHGDLDVAAIFWQRIVESNAYFRKGKLALQLEKLHTKLRSNHLQYFLKRARSAQKAGDWRKAAGCWQALLEQDVQNSEARQAVEQCLRTQGTIAGGSGDWEQAISLWKALLELDPLDAQAKRQLALARHNLDYVRYYQDAQQFIEDDMLLLAKSMLSQLYDDAPYYGDPLGLTQKAGITGPIRFPATLEEEEGKKQMWAQWEKVELEMSGIPELEADNAWSAQGQDQQAQDAIPLPFQREKDEVHSRAQQVQEDEEKARPLTIEQAKRRSPAWFIYNDLKTEPLAAWCNCIFLLSGIGSAAGVITQSWGWAIGAMTITLCVAYVSGHHRIVHRLPERLQHRVQQDEQRRRTPHSGVGNKELDSTAIYVISALMIVVLSSLITFCIMLWLVTPLRYNLQHIDHFLWVSRTSWLGGQIKAGVIVGAILSFISMIVCQMKEDRFGVALLKALIYGSLITFTCWVVSSSCALLFNLGWGFGSGWEVSLSGLGIGIASGIGLGSSFVIWARGKPIF